MPDVVQAKCPYCHNLLRIPAQWVQRPMRCKHCLQVFQARQKRAPVPAAPVAVTASAAVSAQPEKLFTFDVPSNGPALEVPPIKRTLTRKGWWEGIVLGGLVLAVAVGVTVVLGPHLASLFSSGATDSTENEGPKPQAEVTTKKSEPPRAVEPKRKATDNDPFPRRALLISVNDYLFANPLHYGYARRDKFLGASTGDLRHNLQVFLHFPATQCLELSDRAVDPQAPLKPVIEKTIEQFLATSLAHDHVVLFFAGHVVESDKEAYLVPIDGQLDVYESLIPLSWVYGQLQKTPARQKVLIVDVCRFDPARGNERPGGGPMGKALDSLLLKPPAGVQVWSSCTLEQQGYEFEDGSLFLMGLNHALINLKRIQEHPQPLPIADLALEVSKFIDVKLAKEKELKQAPRLAGSGPIVDALFDPDQKSARLIVQNPAPSGATLARREHVEKILEEINIIPPVRVTRAGAKDGGVKISNLPPFGAKEIEPYRPTDSIFEFEKQAEQFPFRAEVAKALRVLQNDARKFSMKESFAGTTTAAVKKQVFKEQLDPGKACLFLEEALDELQTVADKRDAETSPRWKALYDFVTARMMSRIVYVTEYNYLLALIRSDALPELPPGGIGYRVGFQARVAAPEGKIRVMVKEIKRAWDKIEREHAGTPWALIAQRERLNALGLEWRVTRQ